MWLIVDKSEVIGDSGDKFYSAGAITVAASSVSCEAYTAVWYRRSGVAEDPWVSVRDHRAQEGELMVYGQSSSSAHTSTLETSGGMGVYIRKH